MVDGPEHHAEAERLLAEAVEHRKGGRTTPHAMLMIEARTHATLALAASSVGERRTVAQVADEYVELCAAVREYLRRWSVEALAANEDPTLTRLRELVGGA